MRIWARAIPGRGKKYTEIATVAPGDTHAESGAVRSALAGSAAARG